MYIILALIPSIIGLAIFFIYADFSNPQWVSAFSWLKCFGGVGIFLIVVNMFLPHREEQGNIPTYPDDPYNPIDYKDISIKKINNHTIKVNVRGTNDSYIVEKDLYNQIYVQQFRRGKEISPKVVSHPSLWKSGDAHMAEYMRLLINNSRKRK
jgi:hypothetical protein